MGPTSPTDDELQRHLSAEQIGAIAGGVILLLAILAAAALWRHAAAAARIRRMRQVSYAARLPEPRRDSSLLSLWESAGWAWRRRKDPNADVRVGTPRSPRRSRERGILQREAARQRLILEQLRGPRWPGDGFGVGRPGSRYEGLEFRSAVVGTFAAVEREARAATGDGSLMVGARIDVRQFLRKVCEEKSALGWSDAAETYASTFEKVCDPESAPLTENEYALFDAAYEELCARLRGTPNPCTHFPASTPNTENQAQVRDPTNNPD
eukprot:CAMPEP_0198364526 /NCGR_PEP_ID=MMETSP1450-20131203/153707_1 /TAXON_ID=753684 ORGANISM="Madagascaria erythrocladiodes, Strain CCMP3234" /NCGR_SAMPLE_ID=MMETSP1450 /ASSEMBLY_ACC=CAM_ASM_001115 /LENGTH=266 /DNA_ID=CAMNT_0044071965 /DNA_START=565 /DNA_END=1365 /DNA_ORIENTATION=-